MRLKNGSYWEYQQFRQLRDNPGRPAGSTAFYSWQILCFCSPLCNPLPSHLQAGSAVCASAGETTLLYYIQPLFYFILMTDLHTVCQLPLVYLFSSFNWFHLNLLFSWAPSFRVFTSLRHLFCHYSWVTYYLLQCFYFLDAVTKGFCTFWDT